MPPMLRIMKNIMRGQVTTMTTRPELTPTTRKTADAWTNCRVPAPTRIWGQCGVVVFSAEVEAEANR